MYLHIQVAKLLLNIEVGMKDSEIVRLLKKYNLNDFDEVTLIHVAVKSRDSQMLRDLVASGININQKDSFGFTPLMFSFANNDQGSVSFLLENKAIFSLSEQYWHLALGKANKEGRYTEINNFLNKIVSDPYHREELEEILLWASKYNYLEVIKAALHKGIDVDYLCGKARTPLMYASANGNIDAVEILLKHGANCNAIANNGDTPLVYATQNCHEKIVDILLENGADVNLKNQEGNTALLFASEGGAENIVKLLLNKGADVNIQNIQGRTALMTAASKNHSEIVKYLLKNNADVTLCDEAGFKAIDLATNKEVKKLLFNS